jgi:serine/threonine protein kinase
VLSAILPLFCHETDIEMQTTIAHHFGVLRNVIDLLKAHYENLPSIMSLGIERRALYLYPCQYMLLDSSDEYQFKYKSQIDQAKLIFFGETDSRGMICIKFVHCYSQEVHQCCAELEFAPALRAFNRMPRGWYMVVMDALDKDYVILSLTVDQGTLDNIRAKVISIHQEGFVHGDIRDTNIMVNQKKRGQFMLVDFDWVGKIEEVRYPISVYRGTRLWQPDGACDGNLITADHDIKMLDHLQSC